MASCAGIELKISQRSSLAGGCISNVELITAGSDQFILKKYSRSGITHCEANGLYELKKSGTVTIPEVISVSDNELLLEYFRPGRKSSDFDEQLGRSLAAMHKCSDSSYGFYENNWIGETVQINSSGDNWSDFYTNHRLVFQIKRAQKQGVASKKLLRQMDLLLPKVPQILSGSEEVPSLIHGDLWSGNVIADSRGEPVLIDPAVYYGHREAELAMTALFGGFSQKFYDAYNEYYPLCKNWRKRQALYKLYHILNHLNLFGKSYETEVLNLINYYI